MKDLSQRHIDRVTRKAENALADDMPFDTTRGGIGKVGKCCPKDEREAIDAATNEKIARTAAALGVTETKQPEPLPATVGKRAFKIQI